MNVIDTKNASLPERFAVQVHQSPDALAVFTQENQLTFAELNGRVNQLARLLQQQGVGLETTVGVCLERSVEMVVALLAVLKAGAAYVPIDPAYPPERIKWMLADAETAVCLTHSQLAHKLPKSAHSQTIFLDQSDFVLSLLPGDDLAVTVQPDNLAYIIYTSGSTGKPKGAMITHGGLANYLDWALEAYPAEAGGAPVHSSIGFDLTVTSLFVPLLAGQTVHLLPEGDAGTLLGQALAEVGNFGLVKITPAHLLLLNQIIPAEQAANATQSFVVGGEQLTTEQLTFWRKHAPHTRLFNEYGPTETVVGCCVYEILPEDDLSGAVPIGQPIANTQLYVLDEQMQPVPEGEVGELYIGGVGVARGYLKRPSLTAEKFVPDPFSGVPGARLYRTGDLARVRPDGNFEFLGRMDHQVKIRGYRIELGEIEAVLGQHKNVRETAVLVHETSGSKQLIAYLTAEQPPAPLAGDLRTFLAQRLPEYMVPARFVLLNTMPLTINGKIDRQALPAPESARPELPQPYAAPRNSQEETLANIWSDVLGVSPVGIHDSFFGLGGDSILGIQIVARARAAGLDLSQAQLFQQPTVAELATAVSTVATTYSHSEVVPLLTTAEQAQLQAEFGARLETAYPLSPLQEGILFHTLLHPEDDIYFEQPAFTLDGPLQPELLVQAWQQVVARHPILRTIFVWDGWERPLQIVLKQAAPRTLLLDWRHLNAAEQVSQTAQFLAENQAAGLSLTQPPHHLTLIRLGEQETRFIWTVHHIIIDGWTESLLYQELFAIYEAMLRGETAVLPEPEPFETFIRWQRQQDWREAKQFWQDALAGFAVPTPLTVDLGQPTERHRTQTYGELRRQLSGELYDALKQFSRTHGLTPGTLLQAAWGLLLSRYSGEPDVVFGTMMSGRVPQLPGVDQMAGVLINPVPLRCQIAPEDTVLPWLRQFQSNLLALQKHETTPLVQVQSWSELSADQPLFESLLVLENYPRQRKAAGGQLTIRDYFSYERTNYPLTLRLVPDEALDVFLVFAADRLTETAVSRLFDHYCNLLRGMVADAERPLAQLPLITEAETQQLIFEWNTWDTRFAQTSCIHHAFERQAAQTPDALAVKFGSEQLTYAQLNAKVNQLAHFLQHRGVQPDDLVALYLERSLEMVIAILGVLKAGGAYLPMDTVYPEDRLAFMLDDAQPVALLTSEKLVAGGKLQGAGGDSPFTVHNSQLIILDTDWSQIAKSPTTNPTSAVQPHNRAYVIYTSGSTGKPKGVLVTHANVMRLMQATDDWYHFGQNDVWTLFHSYAFDFSVWEIWGALLYGGRLIVVPYLISRSPHDFYQLLVAEGVTVLNQTPSAFRQLIQAEAEVGQADNLALRTVIFGGEALELHTLQPWFDRHGDQKPQLINMYGITETTVHVTYRPIYSNDVAQAPGSVIGRAIPDLQLYILDPQHQPVPIGVPGEIYVGGAGVAAGYLNRPELTAERFVPLSVISNQLSVISKNELNTDHWSLNTVYRTGDLARWLPDGDIEYLGRIDHQVKIRGFRIELGEIEAALGGHTAVRQVLVLVREDEPGEKRLVAYLVLDPDQPLTVTDLHSYLQPKLPAYMVPAAFVLLDAFPLTHNGKIDRRALPQPDETRPDLERPYTPPRSRAEEILAEIFSRVLNVARVGIDDNYFELGGDSIRSIQILAQAKQAGLNFSLADLFNLQTIGRLSEQMARIELVEAGVSAIDVAPFSLIDEADRAELPPTVEDAYPLSKLQAGMLFHSELEAETAVYHNVTSWQIEAPFDAAKLTDAVQQLAAKHTVLRTSFDLTSYSEPLQLVWPQVKIPVTVHDLRPLPTEAQDEEIARWVWQTVAEKFDWTQPPLLRFHFFQRSETTFQMIMAEHHAILDGWSVASLVTELFQTYSTLLRGTEIAPATAVPYREFVAAEQRTLASKTARAFWQETLAESSVSLVPRLPLPEAEADLPETAVHQTILTTDQVTQLSQVALQAGVPLKSVLLAAHLKVLGGVCGQKDVLSGLVLNGRTEHSGSERALGLFLNTVPFRQKLAAGSWLDLIRHTFATEKTILPYRRFPLAEIQQMLGGQPLFEVPFNYLHFHVFDELAHQEQVKIADEQFYGHANFSLAVEAELNPANGTLALRLEYNPAEFGAAQIERLAGYYSRTLVALAAEPDAAHESFSMLSEAERQLLLHDWNATETAVPHQLIHEWVAQVAEERGEQTAVTFHNQQLTYAQLNARANQLAHYLQANGVGPETLVAVYLNRSLEMVIAALAVLKAGGAYLPLDTTYPDERLHFMLADAKAAFVLTTEALRAPLNDLRLRLEMPHPMLIAMDNDWPKIAQCGEQNPDSSVMADNVAYIIYTSGSTGQPKGVMVTHRGVPNLAQAQHKAFGIGPDSRVLQFAAFGFDASVSEMFVTLTAGATLVLAEAEAMLPGPDLAALVKEQRVTAVTLPPSALAILNPDDFPSLQTVVAAGEACSAEIVAKWAEGRRFVNGYGPTEATVCATTAVLAPTEAQAHIGRPIDNVQLYILNENQQPVPLGTPGELYIGGIGVARGYLNRPELTAEKFIKNPYDKVTRRQGDKVSEETVTLSPAFAERLHLVTPSRLYRTGDLVRYLPDGNVEFLGRIDHQVKLRGYRIELGEIETVLRRQTAVQDALVLARDDAGTGPQLVAYVVGPHASMADLRVALNQRLPAYMVPAAFVQLDAFPLTPNGKIDRKALPAPVATAVAQYVPPRNDVELVIANLWAETLKLPRVGIHDNFFELGGHSLLATQLVTRLRQTLRIELSLRALFDSPTVAAIAEVALQSPNNRSHVEKVAQLLIKLSQLSDEEAAKLLSQKR